MSSGIPAVLLIETPFPHELDELRDAGPLCAPWEGRPPVADEPFARHRNGAERALAKVRGHGPSRQHRYSQSRFDGFDERLGEEER